MINFDFDYYRPDTAEEAVELMQTLRAQNRSGVFFSGGTEILSFFRKGKAKADAVIDIKAIEGIQIIEDSGESYVIGAAAPLNHILKSPFLSALHPVLSRIADHTVRNTLTIGGNICGKLPYKEGVLPLLAMNASLVIAGPQGRKTVTIRDIFQHRLALEPGEFVFQIHLPKTTTPQTYCQRETAGPAVDYPLMLLYGQVNEDELFVGLAGYAAYPVHCLWDWQALGQESAHEVLARIMNHFEPLARSDERGSADYRRQMLKEAILRMTDAFKEGHHG